MADALWQMRFALEATVVKEQKHHTRTTPSTAMWRLYEWLRFVRLKILKNNSQENPSLGTLATGSLQKVNLLCMQDRHLLVLQSETCFACSLPEDDTISGRCLGRMQMSCLQKLQVSLLQTQHISSADAARMHLEEEDKEHTEDDE